MTVLHKPDPVSSLLGSACQRVDVEWESQGHGWNTDEKQRSSSRKQWKARKEEAKRVTSWQRKAGRRKQCKGEIYSVEERLSKHTVHRGTGMQSRTASLFTPAWAFQQLSVSKLSYLNRRNSGAAASWKWSAWTGEDPDFSGGSKCFWLCFIYN